MGVAFAYNEEEIDGKLFEVDYVAGSLATRYSNGLPLPAGSRAWYHRVLEPGSAFKHAKWFTCPSGHQTNRFVEREDGQLYCWPSKEGSCGEWCDEVMFVRPGFYRELLCIACGLDEPKCQCCNEIAAPPEQQKGATQEVTPLFTEPVPALNLAAEAAIPAADAAIRQQGETYVQSL